MLPDNLSSIVDESDIVKPLSSDLIARDKELDSVSQIREDRLVEINLAYGKKGVYLFDRGYDDRSLFASLNRFGMNFIGSLSYRVGNQKKRMTSCRLTLNEP